jgi:hypothetical protein
MTAPWIAAILGLWAVVLLIAALGVGLLRRATATLEGTQALLRGMTRKPDVGGLTEGARLRDFDAIDAHGGRVHSASFRGQPTIYLLMDNECGPCEELERELTRDLDWLDGIRLVAIFEGGDHPHDSALPSEVEVLFQRAAEVSSAFESSATPHAFAVDGTGVVVAKTVPNSVEHLRELAQSLNGTERG